MEIKARLEVKKNKEGKDYKVIIIPLTDRYEKYVFLDRSELEMLRMAEENKKTSYK